MTSLIREMGASIKSVDKRSTSIVSGANVLNSQIVVERNFRSR